jgi:TPR repeat protein
VGSTRWTVAGLFTSLCACAAVPPAQFGPQAEDIPDPANEDFVFRCEEEQLACETVTFPPPIGRRRTVELLAELKPRCQAGAKNTCLAVAILEELRRNYDISLQHFLRACELGHAHGCSRAGFALGQSDWGHYDPARSLELMHRACDELDDGYGCGQLGAFYEYGVKVEIDVAKARSYYERACAQAATGGGIGCLYLAELYGKGKGVSVDEEKSRQILTDACEAGAEVACGGLAEDMVADEEYERGRELAEQSCSHGALRGCTVLGLMMEKGLGGFSVDLQSASRVYEHACSLGDSLGCVYFATAHMGEWFEGADPAIGRQIYERECLEGVTAACGWHATVLLLGAGGPADVEAAAKLAFDTCERKQGPRACFVAGIILFENPSSPADQEKAISHFEYACEGGVPDACSALEQLGRR